jgi:hypothetical protein
VNHHVFCEYCGAIVWYEERTAKSRKPPNPKFSLYCMEGQVKLPLLKKPPATLEYLLNPAGGQRSKNFKA